MEDFPIEFEFDLLELEKKKLARQNRIVAGRLESLKYKAKIEFPYVTSSLSLSFFHSAHSYFNSGSKKKQIIKVKFIKFMNYI